VLDRGDAAEFVESDPAGEEGGGTAVASGGYPVAGQKNAEAFEAWKNYDGEQVSANSTFNIQHSKSCSRRMPAQLRRGIGGGLREQLKNRVAVEKK
jgi:hypothetical protein